MLEFKVDVLEIKHKENMCITYSCNYYFIPATDFKVQICVILFHPNGSYN